MNFTADAFDQRVELHWSPVQEVAGYTIRRSVSGPPASPYDGDFVYIGSGWQLTGLNSDRGLENGTTYFYSIFPLGNSGLFGPPQTLSATPKKMEEPKNLLLNPNFQNDFTGWKIIQPEGSYDLTGNGLKMVSSATVASQIEQTVTGLKPKTLYTATMHAFGSNPEMAYTMSIDGDIQQQEQYFCCPRKKGFGPITYSYIDETLTGYWKLFRFVFWTGEETSPEVTITLLGPKVKEASSSIYVEYSDLALQEGLLPMPDAPLDPKHPFVKPNKPLALPGAGENLIVSHWNLVRATDANGVITLAPSQDFTAEAVQLSPYYLKSGTHTLTAMAKVEPGKIAYLTLSDAEGDFSKQVKITSNEWTAVSIPFEGEWIQPLITFSGYKQQGNHWNAQLKEVELKATGYEWIPTANPDPQMQLEPKTWDFTLGQFDPDEWMVFGRMNSYPQNLSFVSDGLQFTAYGQKATKNPLQAAVIATRDYFASGRYDVWLKVGPVYDAKGNVMPGKRPFGCSFPVWPFGYIYYMDGQPQWYDSPSPIRNSEIDIEIPADAPAEKSKCPPDIRWTNGRLNCYGGQRGGISSNITMHTQMPNDIDIADGAFHKLSIVWDSGSENGGGERTAGSIHWYIDDQLWGSWAGATYGFDNVPYRCCRFYVGGWFPIGEYGPPGCKDTGWAGTADWYRAEFTVQKIEYTPPLVRPSRDSWEPETDPDQVWNPKFYPKS